MSASGVQQVPYQVHQGRPLGATYQTRDFLNSQLFRLILEAVKDKKEGLRQAYNQIREQNGENTVQYLSKVLQYRDRVGSQTRGVREKLQRNQ